MKTHILTDNSTANGRDNAGFGEGREEHVEVTNRWRLFRPVAKQVRFDVHNKLEM